MVAPYPTASRHPAKSPASGGASLKRTLPLAGFVVSGRCSRFARVLRWQALAALAGWSKIDHLSCRHAQVFVVGYGEVRTHLRNKGLRDET